MIAPAKPRARRAPARCYWHRFFVIWPRLIWIEQPVGWPKRARVFWQPMLRRWSQSRTEWLWAMPGCAPEGTRVPPAWSLDAMEGGQ